MRNQHLFFKSLEVVYETVDRAYGDGVDKFEAGNAVFAYLSTLDAESYESLLSQALNPDFNDHFDNVDTEAGLAVVAIQAMQVEIPEYDVIDWNLVTQTLREEETRRMLLNDLRGRLGKRLVVYRNHLQAQTPVTAAEWSRVLAEKIPHAIIAAKDESAAHATRYHRYCLAVWRSLTHLHGGCGMNNLPSSMTQHSMAATFEAKMAEPVQTPVPHGASNRVTIVNEAFSSLKIPLGFALATQDYTLDRFSDDQGSRDESVPISTSVIEINAYDERAGCVGGVTDACVTGEGHGQDRDHQILIYLHAVLVALDLEIDGVQVRRRSHGGSVRLSGGVGDMKDHQIEEKAPELVRFVGPFFNGFHDSICRRGQWDGGCRDLQCELRHGPVELQHHSHWPGVGNVVAADVTGDHLHRVPIAVLRYQDTAGDHMSRQGQMEVSLAGFEGNELHRFLACVQFLMGTVLKFKSPALLRDPVLSLVMSQCPAQGLTMDECNSLFRLHGSTSSVRNGIVPVAPTGHPREATKFEMRPSHLGQAGVFSIPRLVVGPSMFVEGAIRCYGVVLNQDEVEDFEHFVNLASYAHYRA